MARSAAAIDFFADENGGSIVIVTASDSTYYRFLLNFIGGLHRVDFEHLKEIMVFDLGLEQEQKAALATIKKVGIYAIEKVNQDVLRLFTTTHYGKKVAGWYAWKPVAIKQALDRYPTILWMDAGTNIFHSILPLFKHVEQHGFFGITVNHSIAWGATSFVRAHFDGWVDFNENCVAGGHLGFSRKLYKTIVHPIYQHVKDLRFFADDGTTPDGFGTGRHDQILWSIYIRKYQLPVMPADGWMMLNVDGNDVPFHMHWHYQGVTKDTTLLQCRSGWFYDHLQYIQYKEAL
ncbi:MAG: hypothetical protein WD068_00465 [Candidatus Babeliales bacterium]